MLSDETAEPHLLNTSQVNTELLYSLLDAEALKSKCKELDLGSGSLTKSQDYHPAAESPHAIASGIVDQIEQANELSTRFYFELLASGSVGTWGPHLVL
jgi:hypothetical protein